MRRMVLYIYANLFNVWLETLNSHTWFYIQSVKIGCLVEVDEDNLASHRCVVGKGKGILIAFFR